MGVQPGADSRPAERDLAEPLERALDPCPALAHLRGVAAELLAEGDGDRVHPVRPARLDDVGELGRLPLERRAQVVERGQEVVHDLVERREVHSRREHVVRALAHVHVVVCMHVLAGEGCDHLVGIHVRRRARAGLKDVDRELVVELAVRDAIRGGGDPARLLLVEELELAVDECGGRLDPAEPPRHRGGDRLAGDGEVGDRLAGLASPQLWSGGGVSHIVSVARGAESRSVGSRSSLPGLEQLLPARQLDARTAERLAGSALDGVDRLPACVVDVAGALLLEQLVK